MHPKFAVRASELLDFLSTSEVIAHNAAFDLQFLDYELSVAGRPTTKAVRAGIVDTLAIARELYPGESNSLIALCEWFGVTRVRAVQSSALFDAQCLADLYPKLTAAKSAYARTTLRTIGEPQ